HTHYRKNRFQTHVLLVLKFQTLSPMETKMNQFKRLISVVTLALVLATPALAGDPTQPCSTNPGETSAPPCPSSPMVSDDQTIADTEVGLIVIETTVSAIESLIAIL